MKGVKGVRTGERGLAGDEEVYISGVDIIISGHSWQGGGINSEHHAHG